ncbi:hypothetical protein A1342_16575 [Methylomonas methanica]|uniref:DUF3391 domain-containing protein n=2 Tax=Methylomonas TaxID=416 RepID=A0A126T1Y9_9GAMM|nr:DUF3391 domain-containing protein [Methylomonas denitrificans]AMK76088.1 hypothetical protein JT25_006200 [Methylomonas denitrificans]OAH99786.1 hypothetical protein A1342_16575 [Methylomonas methanica]
MFVCGTDRKWIDTPFFRTKFLISSDKQINTLKEYCQTVSIDTGKGIDVDKPAETDIVDSSGSAATEMRCRAEENDSAYSVNCIVELQTDELAIVVKENLRCPQRPLLKVITNPHKQLLFQERSLDLADEQQNQIKIVRVLASDEPIIELLKMFVELEKV